MKPSNIGAILIGLSSLMSFGLFAADIDAGKTKSAVCAGCHGGDGNSINPIWPSLAGQHAAYLAKQLKEFKSDVRVDPTMKGMAAILATDADIENVAAFFASQKSKPVKFDKELATEGESIFRGGITEASVPACMGCHGPDASGLAAAGFPSLKSQHPAYLVAQLKKFRDGSRSNDTGKMMQNVAARMSDKEIMAVAAYIAGIQ